MKYTVRIFNIKSLKSCRQNKSTYTVGPLHPQFLCLQIQPTVDPKKPYFFKDIRKSQKAQVGIFCACNYLHNIYVVFTTYVAVQSFPGCSDSKESTSNAVGDMSYTVLGMMSNLEPT